jgi:hypothetical protein
MDETPIVGWKNIAKLTPKSMRALQRHRAEMVEDCVLFTTTIGRGRRHKVVYTFKSLFIQWLRLKSEAGEKL